MATKSKNDLYMKISTVLRDENKTFQDLEQLVNERNEKLPELEKKITKIQQSTSKSCPVSSSRGQLKEKMVFKGYDPVSKMVILDYGSSCSRLVELVDSADFIFGEYQFVE